MPLAGEDVLALGDEVAQSIQLYMAYAPEPPFNAGTPETAPAAILAQTRQSAAAMLILRPQNGS